MINQAKRYSICGETIFALVMGLSSPSIHLYFMRLVHPKVFSFVVLLGTFLSAVVMRVLQNDKHKATAFYWFKLIMFLDNIGFTIFGLGLIHYPNARFIGMCFFNAVTTGLWMALMTASFNDKIHGEDLTDFNFKKREWSMWAALAGGIGSIIIATEMTEWHIFWLVMSQCLGNFIMSMMDWKAYQILKGDCSPLVS